MENFARPPPCRKRGIAFEARYTIGVLTLMMALASWAQDPFSSLGASAQSISTGTFVTGLVEFAIVIAGLLLAFSGRVLGGVLVAIVGGGMLALSAAKWEGWIQGL